MLDTDKKYWAVWKKSCGAAPSKRHETLESAVEEAARLARKEGDDYYVLEAVAVVGLPNTPVEVRSLVAGKDES